ncbi:hypothetical protein [Nonomuraea sp. NPDC050691]|uniref:hypothetical protein n=1 Tax=Nonomuraea sp. NPDC050691 TaxID=3155661 RepID=UPI0033EA39AD
MAALEVLLGERRIAGRAELAEAMRILATEAAPDCPAGAPGDYLEPRLFSQLVRPGFEDMTLEQLLFGRAAEKPAEIVAMTDATGVVSLPGLGSCRTGFPQARVSMRFDRDARSFTVRSGAGGTQVCPLAPSRTVGSTGIEVVDHLDPMLAGFLANHVEAAERLTLVDDPGGCLPDLSRALDLIAAVRPEFHGWLSESLMGVLLFRHPDAEPFAALGMHGMIFLNVPQSTTAAYFVEQFTHQGGHVVFSEATLRRGDFFAVDPETPLADFIAQDDPRIVYDAFHGLYTEHMELQIYRALLQQGLVTEAEGADLRDFAAAVSKRHATDLALIAPRAKEIFSEEGLAVFGEFQSDCESENNGHG